MLGGQQKLLSKTEHSIGGWWSDPLLKRFLKIYLYLTQLTVGCIHFELIPPPCGPAAHNRMIAGAQSCGSCKASHRASAEFTATGFSWAIQWPDET